MSRVLRTAIVGCGKVAHLHAQALRGMPEAQLVAVVDSDADRARAFAAQYGVPSAGDLAGVEVAIICTPHPMHRASAIAAMKGVRMC